jgi:hypothetical protein
MVKRIVENDLIVDLAVWERSLEIRNPRLGNVGPIETEPPQTGHAFQLTEASIRDVCIPNFQFLKCAKSSKASH